MHKRFSKALQLVGLIAILRRSPKQKTQSQIILCKIYIVSHIEVIQKTVQLHKSIKWSSDSLWNLIENLYYTQTYQFLLIITSV